jgi:hypothetical protein
VRRGITAERAHHADGVKRTVSRRATRAKRHADVVWVDDQHLFGAIDKALLRGGIAWWEEL